jgi:gliding motility-associated-like protein
MKRFLLLGILLFAYGSIFSQKIFEPTRNPSIVCLETEMEIEFVVNGSFGLDCKFEILLSDVDTDFSNPIKIGEVTYEVGKTTYSGIYSVAGVPVDKYYIKVISTNPSDVESPVSKQFSVVENDPVNIVADGPTEFCDGGGITLVTESPFDNRNFEWYKVSSPNDDYLGNYQELRVEETGTYYAVSVVGSCTETSNEIDVVETIAPKSLIAESDQEVCFPNTGVFTAASTDIEKPYYEWLDAGDVVVGKGAKFTTNVGGTYRLRTTNYGNISPGGGCADVSDPVTLIVHDFQAEISESGPIKECSGAEITLNSIEVNPDYIYNWKFNGTILPNPISGKGKTSFTFISKESDSGNYTLEIVSPVCTKESSPALVIDIKDPPTPSIVETDQKGCEGVTVTLTSGFNDVNNDYTYQWYLGSNPVSGEQSKTIDVIISASTQGDYFLEMSYANCAVKSTPVNIKLVKTPVSLMHPDVEAIACESESVTLNAVSENIENASYSWIDSNDVEVGTGTQFITDVPGDYRLVTTNDGACNNISPVTTVIISPLAESKIKYSSLLDCEKVVLEADSDLKGADPSRVIYKWYKDADLTPVQEGINPALNVYDSGDYKLETLNYGLCGDISAPVTVVINDLDPSIDESANPVLVCVNAEHTLTAVESDPTYTYIWFRELVGSGVVEEVQNSNSPTYIIKGTSANVGEWDYSLRVISPECDKISTPISVIVPASPIADISPDVDQTVCSEIILKSVGINPGANITYQWFKNGSEIASATSTEYTVTTDGDYFFKVYNYDVCESTSKTVNISFVDFEHGIAEGDVVKECEEAGQFLQLTSINTDPKYTYKWLKGTQEVGNTMVLDIERLESNSGQYTLQVSEGVCMKESDPVDVMILATPVSVITSAPSKYCEGDSFQINSKETDGNYDYVWFYNDVEITSTTSGGLFENFDTPTLTVTMDNATVGDYQVKVSVGNCGGSKSPKVHMSMYDKFNTYVDVYPGTMLCENGTITLTVTASEKISKYTWFKNGKEISGATESNYEVTSIGTYVVVLEPEVGGCPQSADEVVVTSAPDMGVVEDVIYVRKGETATFEAFGGDKYMWLDEDGNVLQNGGDTFDVESEENASYQVKISNAYCSKTIKLQVISTDLTSDDIQNIMTPNGDGFNDTWKLPTGFVSSGDEVIILNRQGSIVYKSSNYNDDWAGTMNDGPALPSATYYYVIKRKGKEPIMGSITIFR